MSAKFESRYEGSKSKFSLIVFAYNLMIGHILKRIEKIILQSAFDKKTKKPGLKLIPGLALTSVRTRLKQRPVFVTRIFPYGHYKKQMKESCSRQMMKVTFVPCNYGGPGNKGKIRLSITS